MSLKRSKSESEEEVSTISSGRPEYSENIWTKDDGRIDGYSFKGKRIFGKALMGLRGVMKRGVTNEIEGVKYIALDNKLQGAGYEIDVQITDKNQRGVAILKIYGPKENEKKDNTVTITKSKNSDSKFVVLLAEKVVRPLMNGFLSGELTIKENKDEEKPKNEGSSVKQFKCSFCEKICKTQRGLKGHTTKMHLRDEAEIDEKQSNKRKCSDDVDQVVEDVLQNVVNVTDDESKNNSTEEKIYTKSCEKCDIELQTNKKYTLLRSMSQHKDQCISNIKCIRCNKRFKEADQLKKHKCEKQRLNSASKSPPQKKKRINEKENIKEDLTDINNSMDEMDIDITNEDDNETIGERDILATRSKLMDDKIIAKEEKNEQEEINYQNKKKTQEEKKKMEEIAIKAKQSAQKQKMKDERKKKNRKQRIFKIPNVKDIPENCRNLVGKDFVVYQVPGDGACAPNCGAAFLFEDEVFGHKLRKNMNYFFAEHFYEHYQYLTQCSPGHPFKRRVKGQIVEFTDPEKLIEYLKTSDDAKYMWSDSEDLSVLADMYQMRIKIITSNGGNDENPTTNWIYPNEDLAKYAEIKNVDVEDMVLLHTNDSHFDLIVSKDSKLATMGSLSFRHNFGPMMSNIDFNEENDTFKKCEKQVEIDTVKDKGEIRNEGPDIAFLQKALKESRESNVKLLKQYQECEKELRNKTEEYEKLKIENRDLKQNVELGERLKLNKKSDYDYKNVHTEKKYQNKKQQQDAQYSCDKSKFQSTSEQSFKTHTKTNHIEEEEFNCNDCPYQATAQLQLNKHINLKHRLANQMTEEVIYCKHCGEQFAEKWSLMNHRKQNHLSTVAFCKNNLKNDCRYSNEMCWWRHEGTENSGQTSCFNCDKRFKTKGEMMIHRKKEHITEVRICMNYQKNNCRFRSSFCWYLHEEENMDVEDNFDNKKTHEPNKEEEIFQSEKEILDPVFQKVVKPPIIK